MNYRVVWRRRLRNAFHDAAFYAHEMLPTYTRCVKRLLTSNSR